MDATPPEETLPSLNNGDIRPLVFYPEKNLRSKSLPVPEEVIGSAELRELVADMIATMYATGGVGLSAIQVGVPWRLYILDPYHNVPGRPSQLRVCVNPRLEPVDDAEPVRMKEGCLSFPGLTDSLERPDKVRLVCVTHRGDEVNTVLDSWPARIAQHEQDHLDGTLFLDRMGGVQLRMAKKKLAKFRKSVERAGKRPAKKRR